MRTLRERKGATSTTHQNRSARRAADRGGISTACSSLEHMDLMQWTAAVRKDDFPCFSGSTPWTNNRHTLPFILGVTVRANMIRRVCGILVNAVNKGMLALDPHDPYQADFHFLAAAQRADTFRHGRLRHREHKGLRNNAVHVC